MGTRLSPPPPSNNAFLMRCIRRKHGYNVSCCRWRSSGFTSWDIPPKDYDLATDATPDEVKECREWI